MSDNMFALVWKIPVLIFAIILIFGGLFKDLFAWLKEKA